MMEPHNGARRTRVSGVNRIGEGYPFSRARMLSRTFMKLM